MSKINISGIRLRRSSEHERRTGILGYLSFLLGGVVRIDGVTLRETARGKLTLSYPARRDGQGRDHSCIAPISDEARVHIEMQVFAALPQLIKGQGES